MYTDDKNVQVVLSLLKAYKIRKAVISPGTTNVPITRSMEKDSFFELYSVVDERSAAYLACGLSFSSGEPVVIACTGATASRNYIPALTEAYYRNLPVIAITCRHEVIDFDDLYPQVIDRTISQNDIKRFSALLPKVKDNDDLKRCIYLVNKALTRATTCGQGPVHIDLPTSSEYSFNTKKLPFFTKWERYTAESMNPDEDARELCKKRVAVFIGSHKPFSSELTKALGDFSRTFDAAVICDHTSNYNGCNKISSSVIADLIQSASLPDLVIDIGSVCGDYSITRFYRNVPTWRVSEDGVIHNRQGVQKLQKIYAMSESFFFSSLAKTSFSCCGGYFKTLSGQIREVVVPVLPLSNTYVCSQLSSRIPHGSTLHLSILNSLRNMDFFPLDPSITVSANVGGFGIDGSLSTTIGHSLANPNRLTFCLVGDLAFFYDMNALGIRSIGANIRILIVNNDAGVEFRLNKSLERQWASDTDEYIAAKGHFGSARDWVVSMGFEYISASTKEQFDMEIDDFTSPDIDHFNGNPVVFEVFTKIFDEQQALDHLRDMNRPIKQIAKPSFKKRVTKAAPESVKKIYRKLMR